MLGAVWEFYLMHSLAPSRAGPELSEALDLMTRALAILDAVDAPGKIGATLDLAIATLSELLGQDAHGASSVQSLIEQLEEELSRTDGQKDAGHSPWEISKI